MGEKVLVAGIQMNPKLAAVDDNLSKCIEFIQLAAAKNVKLVVFPECSLTGYYFESLNEAISVAETVSGHSIERITNCCKENDIYTVIGLLEKEADSCYNTALLIGPDGIKGKQRKLHLPFLGVDRFLTPGDLPLTVYDVGFCRIGIGICYDMMFPEHSRVLALQGADILVFPANWPNTGNVYPDYIIPTRAIENRVFFIAVNRVGQEGEALYAGRSKIVDWLGVSQAEGKRNQEDMIIAEIDPLEAREKDWIMEKGKHEVNVIKDRRPEFYGLISDI